MRTNDIDGAYRTEYDLTVIGRKVISVETIEDVIRASSGNEYLPCKEQASVFKQLVSVREEIRVGEIDHFLIKEKHRLSLVYTRR